MLPHTRKFKIGDYVKLVNTIILKGLKGTVKVTAKDFYDVEFTCKDNGQTWIFDDNELDTLILRGIQEDNLEKRWQQ